MKGKFLMPIMVTVFICIFMLFGAIDNQQGCSIDGSIDNYSAVIEVNENGDMIIQEEYQYNYHGDYSAKYRDINFNKYNPKNPITQSLADEASVQLSDDLRDCIEVYKNDVKLTTQLLSETNNYNDKNVAYIGKTGERDELGNIIACDPASSTCESLFLYVPSGFEKMTFKYNYTIVGATTIYDDIASINWKLFEYNEWEIKKGKVTINLPENNYNIETVRCWARGAENGNIDIISNNQITLEFERVANNRALEFRLLSDKSLYPSARPINKVGVTVLDEIIDFETEQARKDNLRILVANIIFYSSFVIVVIMGFVVLFVYKKYDKEYKAEFDGKYYRELPSEITPAEMSYLYYFGTINDEDVTATILDLVRRKYLILDVGAQSVNEKDADFKISLQPNAKINELKAHERQLITWFIEIIGDGKSVTITQIEDFSKKYSNATVFQNQAALFVKTAKEVGKEHHYIETKKDKGVAYGLAIIPLVYVLIVLILGALFAAENMMSVIIGLVILVVYIIYVSIIKRRTKDGNEEFVKWKAFKSFLEDFSHMEDYPMPGIIIWEHYLVYATSLKIADKVMEQLKVKLPNVISEDDLSSATYLGYSRRYHGFYFGYTFGRLSSSISNARSTSMRTIVAHNAQNVSSGGGGGGFSGGSSFGGGGGGGRSR